MVKIQKAIEINKKEANVRYFPMEGIAIPLESINRKDLKI